MELELEPDPGPLEPPEVEPGVDPEVELDVEPEPETEPPALSLDVLPDELLLRVLEAARAVGYEGAEALLHVGVDLSEGG